MNNVWLGMMNATSDVIHAGTFTNLEGPRSSLKTSFLSPNLQPHVKPFIPKSNLKLESPNPRAGHKK